MNFQQGVRDGSGTSKRVSSALLRDQEMPKGEREKEGFDQAEHFGIEKDSGEAGD